MHRRGPACNKHRERARESPSPELRSLLPLHSPRARRRNDVVVIKLGRSEPAYRRVVIYDVYLRPSWLGDISERDPAGSLLLLLLLWCRSLRLPFHIHAAESGLFLRGSLNNMEIFFFFSQEVMDLFVVIGWTTPGGRASTCWTTYPHLNPPSCPQTL